MKKALLVTVFAVSLIGLGSFGYGKTNVADLPSQHKQVGTQIADLPSQHSQGDIQVADLPSQHSQGSAHVADLPSQQGIGNDVA